MKKHLARIALGLTLTAVTCAKAATNETWFGPSSPHNSNATIPSGTSYTSNFGVAFVAGSAGDNSIDWLQFDLNTAGQLDGAASFKVELRNTTNDVAYSAVAGTTSYALDSVSFSMPTTSSTYFSLFLDSTAIPNISSYSLVSGQSYALIVYDRSHGIAIARTSGLAQNTTNDYYTTSNGFQALDTFRNNTPNYSNTTGSYPAFRIAFGSTTAIPEPSATAILAGLSGLTFVTLVRRRPHNPRLNTP
jgi:hypothetical protein